MKHTMSLRPEPFQKIYSGDKTYELRLFDEKRRQVSIDDEIEFVSTENPNFYVRTKVVGLHKFQSFSELYETLPLLKCGYSEENVQYASPNDMRSYYSEEMEKEYGVLAMEVKVLERPYRDIYRFEPFMKEIVELWKRFSPQHRFGQILFTFQEYLKNRGESIYCLEEEDFLERFKDFMYTNY